MDRCDGKSDGRVIPAREDQDQPQLHARQGDRRRGDEGDHQGAVDQDPTEHVKDAEKNAMTTEYQRLNFGPELP